MSRNMLSNVGQCNPDNLTGDNLVFQKRVEVTLETAGTYSRGQLLVIGADGKAALPLAATTAIDGILLDEIGEIDGLEAVPAAVALTGEWNENNVLWGAITDANKAAVIKAAAAKQFYIAPMHKAPWVQFGEV